MKSFKKVMRQFLAVAAVLGMFLAMGLVGEAAASKAPAKIRTYVKSVDSSAIEVTYAEPGSTIKNLKTNSKNLIAKWTRHSQYIGRNESTNSNDAAISLYAKKAGTYKVTFDIYSKEGKKLESKSVKVFAKTDSPFKKVTFRGKPMGEVDIQTVSSGKFKVTMNKGYKLKKIEYGVNSIVADGEDYWETRTTYKAIKNGGTVKLNTKGYYYENKYSYESSYDPEYSYSRWSWNDSLRATTEIRVTYIDKYTKQEATAYFSVSRLAPNKSR